MTGHQAVRALQLGADPGLAVGAVRGAVDLPDQVGQPRMADGSRRRRPGLPLVVTGRGDAEHVSLADADPVTVQPATRRNRSFGGTTCSTAVAALRRIWFSSSRSRIFLRAAASSADSAWPARAGLEPAVDRVLPLPAYRHDSAIPSSWATWGRDGLRGPGPAPFAGTPAGTALAFGHFSSQQQPHTLNKLFRKTWE